LEGGESYNNLWVDFLLLPEEEYYRLVGREVVDFFVDPYEGPNYKRK
jgi:hypothetical protein